MKFDLSSLEKALASLERALRRSQQDKADEELRDAVIQRFEYTYELCWKMLKRKIESEAAVPSDIDALSFKDLIRTGAKKGLLTTPETWFNYREKRNITTHIYNQAKAKEVYKVVADFYQDATDLLKILKINN